MNLRGRYAPSPTGPLHLGNARTALLAWLQVRAVDGSLVMRMEDLDLPRAKKGSAEQILYDLRWMGLDWDEGPDVGGSKGPYLQSQRTELYQQAFQKLRHGHRVYPCYCSRKDIATAVSAPHRSFGTYPGTCRNLKPDQKPPGKEFKRPAWRFRAIGVAPEFQDGIFGIVSPNTGPVDDFIVKRADDLFAYQLAVVIDDAQMGITDVLRGADLLDSTAKQLVLFDWLGYPRPRFWHVPLMNDARGEKLSKRDGAHSIADFREAGGSAADLVGYLAASLGWVPPGTALSSQELLREIGANWSDRLKKDV